MNGYEKQVKNLLKDAGWWQEIGRGKGSHEVWKSPDGKTVSINHQCKSRHTANEILKQAGLPKGF